MLDECRNIPRFVVIPGEYFYEIAVDHFGEGLAALSHLTRLPIDVLKLAPRLTLAATSTGRQAAALESLIQLGRTLGITVIAQGIETVEQSNALLSMGCEIGQGPLYASVLDLGETNRMALAQFSGDLAEAGPQ